MRDIPEPLSMQQRCRADPWFIWMVVNTGVLLRCARASSVVGPTYRGSSDSAEGGSTWITLRVSVVATTMSSAAGISAMLADATAVPVSWGHLELVEGVALLPEAGAPCRGGGCRTWTE